MYIYIIVLNYTGIINSKINLLNRFKNISFKGRFSFLTTLRQKRK